MPLLRPVFDLGYTAFVRLPDLGPMVTRMLVSALALGSVMSASTLLLLRHHQTFSGLDVSWCACFGRLRIGRPRWRCNMGNQKQWSKRTHAPFSKTAVFRPWAQRTDRGSTRKRQKAAPSL